MSEPTTRDEARESILATLNQWKAEGVEDPTIPVYTDSDGDGHPDIFGLSPSGALELRPEAHIGDTVSVSEGGGVETDGEATDNG